MKFLSVSTLLGTVHYYVFRSHKRQFLVQMFFDDKRINRTAGNHIHIKRENPVHRQESLGHADSLVGRIVQCSFQPLRSRSYSRIQGIGNHIASQRANSLTPHRISLICHGRRANLTAFKRLIEFLHVRKQPYVHCKFAGALGYG